MPSLQPGTTSSGSKGDIQVTCRSILIGFALLPLGAGASGACNRNAFPKQCDPATEPILAQPLPAASD
jgi:hypothetical protein